MDVIRPTDFKTKDPCKSISAEEEINLQLRNDASIEVTTLLTCPGTFGNLSGLQ